MRMMGLMRGSIISTLEYMKRKNKLRTNIMMNLFSVCTFAALIAENAGHIESNGRSWKDVADEVLIYDRILDEFDIKVLKKTPIGIDLEDEPIQFKESDEIESVITINYSGHTTDAAISKSGSYWERDSLWEKAAAIKHIIYRNQEIIYSNNDIETTIMAMQNIFQTNHLASK